MKNVKREGVEEKLETYHKGIFFSPRFSVPALFPGVEATFWLWNWGRLSRLHLIEPLGSLWGWLS